MEIHQLRYFRAVANCRSFTKAAKREHVSQPSLSHQILKLEDELGAKLFIRQAGRVGLTRHGEVFLPKIDLILHQLEQAQTQITQLAKVDRGRVTLGVIPTVTPSLLSNVLPAFFKQHPLIEVKVKEETSEVLVHALREQLVDIAVMPLPVDSEEYSCVELIRERLFAVVGENHPLRNEKQISLQQLSGTPLLVLKDCQSFQEDTLAAFRAANTGPRVLFETGCFLTILNMVKAGIGVSVMPEMAAEVTLGCRFIPIAAEMPVRTLGLVQSRKAYPSHVQHLLATFLKAKIGLSLPDQRSRLES